MGCKVSYAGPWLWHTTILLRLHDFFQEQGTFFQCTLSFLPTPAKPQKTTTPKDNPNSFLKRLVVQQEEKRQ